MPNNTAVWAGDIVDLGNHFAQDESGSLYYYAKGAYRTGGEPFIKSVFKDHLAGTRRSDDWTTRTANEVVEYVRLNAARLMEQPHKDFVCVRNGLLHLADRTLYPHRPEYLSPVQLPVDYDPSATCPAVDKFIGQVFPDDAIDVAYEIPGVLGVAGLGQDKAIMIVGPGGNGKGVYLNVITQLIGSSNITAIPLTDWKKIGLAHPGWWAGWPTFLPTSLAVVSRGPRCSKRSPATTY